MARQDGSTASGFMTARLARHNFTRSALALAPPTPRPASQFAARCCHRASFPLVAAAWAFFLGNFALFSVAEEQHWSTGNDFQTAWNGSLSLTWERNPVRPALARLAEQTRVAILLDRRVDPEQELTLTVADEPFSLMAQRIAAKINAGVCRVGPVVYLGPAYVADRLATVAAMRRAEVERMSSATRAKLISPQPMAWKELAEPRTLLADIIAEAGLQPTELAKNIPHDLWPAASLPPLAWADRLSLILAEFDLTFEVDEASRAIRFVPLPASPLAVKIVTVRGTPTKVAAELAQKFPQVETKVVGAKLAVRGRWEDLELVERLARGERIERATVVPGPSNFSLKVADQPAGVVVRHIAKQLMYTLEVGDGVEVLLEKRVSFTADRVTLADLLNTVLKETGARATLQGQKIRIEQAR